MFISLAVSLAALLLLFSAFWLKFRFPGWEFALGVSRLPPEKKANIDVDRLRRYLSAVFYIFSALFFALFLCLCFRTLSQQIIISLCFLILLLFFDFVFVMYRHFDLNEYSKLSRRSGFAVVLCVNALLVFLFFFFIF